MIDDCRKDNISIPRSPFLSLLIASLLIFFSLLGFIVFDFSFAEAFKKAFVTNLRASELRGSILQYDEILTMSAQMFALTGDTQWEERYHDTSNKLADVLAESSTLFPESYPGGASKVTALANDKLTALEKQAFELAHQGKLKEASAIFSSQDYLTQKKIYLTGMESYGHYLNNQVKLYNSNESKRRALTTILLLFLIAAIIIAAIFIYHDIKKWRASLKVFLEKEEKYQQDLQTSYEQLESKVKIRTEELEASNREVSSLNQKLEKIIEQLKKNNHEQDLLNNLYELLLSCKDSTEAYAIIDITANKLFPEDENSPDISSGLAVYNTSTHYLDLVGQAGKRLLLKESFSIDDCWALREGHEYLVDDPTNNMICKHFKSPPEGGYLCIPLVMRNEVIGLFSQNAPAGTALTPKQRQLANSFAAVLKLSIANIKLNEALNEKSIHDSLTGLYNRRYLDEKINLELSRANRLNHIIFVAMLDLDHFKIFNDTSGHEAGDEVLKFVGKLLSSHFRGNDIACRYGGEEFLVILVDADFEGAVARMKSICSEIKNAKIIYHNQILPPITISIGIAQAPKDGETADAIIHAADDALYAAKQAGRDRVEIFKPRNAKP